MNRNDENKKINLLDLDRTNMEKFFNDIGESPFRVNQLMKWIYHHYCDDFDKMTNFNLTLKNKLKKLAVISVPPIVKEQISSDGTIKWALEIDQQIIEMVYIPEIKRSTLCISSQIGCPLQCSFCYTAQQGLYRNLRLSEIVGQIWQAKKFLISKKKEHLLTNENIITNIVFMGMGEPLLNFNNVLSAISIMLDSFGFGLSKRHITLSTSGIIPALNKLSKSSIDIILAISLHAPNNTIRNKIMPINKKYNIEELLSTLKKYYSQESLSKKKKITIEYLMLDTINDHIEHAHELAQKLKNIYCKINLIPWNKFPNAPYKSSSNKKIKQFANILKKYGFTTTIRKIRGNDINAACGQLSGKIIYANKQIKYQKMIYRMNI
ncbi:23S rRNA (adenine(2503)-C(2))-methyltransferase RlmN [Candidatus Schneideria nysicola]|uniref:23S rRNA (adenine(2503)-C(2))-methyltransferase RlmN n=1 Tax=Candidatus Schneideria nysicola TaxID=1081631 RepID=UPI001CAA71B0|nr:23S rRNA (adenine(2503)-C(2))-methyltransferase RlmN [Candidatus Schneideria nysicola]UAJ65886.1 23S rRNA (adenine(2503)-C(2))-methyltransferase RlmN [Candidatus Schneideria nysicola]